CRRAPRDVLAGPRVDRDGLLAVVGVSHVPTLGFSTRSGGVVAGSYPRHRSLHCPRRSPSTSLAPPTGEVEFPEHSRFPSTMLSAKRRVPVLPMASMLPSIVTPSTSVSPPLESWM